jgi:hypothetical protein
MSFQPQLNLLIMLGKQIRVADHADQISDSPVVFDRMAKPHRCTDGVTVSTPFPLFHDITGGMQISNNALNRPFGYSNFEGDFPHLHFRVFYKAEQYM